VRTAPIVLVCRLCNEPSGHAERGHATTFPDDPYEHDCEPIPVGLREEVRDALLLLGDLTTEAFSLGGDREARVALARVLQWMGGATAELEREYLW
jgi:hypothetical protein